MDFPVDAGAAIPITTSIATICLGATFGGAAMMISAFSIAPRRLQFDIENAPAALPLAISILSGSPFVFGWLQVPGSVQTTIATAAQRIRFVGPGYWAVPLVLTGAGEPAPAAPASPGAAPKPTAKSSPAPAPRAVPPPPS